MPSRPKPRIGDNVYGYAVGFVSGSGIFFVFLLLGRTEFRVHITRELLLSELVFRLDRPMEHFHDVRREARDHHLGILVLLITRLRYPTRLGPPPQTGPSKTDPPQADCAKDPGRVFAPQWFALHWNS
jgi:hypothetical protein